MREIRQQFTKALKVIDSCNRPEHFMSAKTYINLFFKVNSAKGKYGTYEADPVIVNFYETLKNKLKRAKRKFYITKEDS